MLIQFLANAAILLASFRGSESVGSYPSSQTRKIQILVPHNIHHHTHTKYHFITVPAQPSTRNKTDGQATPRPPIVLSLAPIVPLLPGVTRNATPPTTPATIQPTTAWQPTQPPATSPPSNFQPSQPILPVFSQPQPPTLPQPQPQQPQAPVPPQQPLQPYREPSSYSHNDYDYNYYSDLSGRDSRNKIVRADPPQPVSTQPPLKYKTIINVHETKTLPVPKLQDITHLINKAYQEGKKIQIPKLFDFRRFLKPDPPKRYTLLYPDKIHQIKQTQADTQRIITQWQELQEELKANPYPGMRLEELEFNPETGAYHFVSQDPSGKSEWSAVKQLLEKQIESDFPGLKINAEFKPIKAVYSDRPPTKTTTTTLVEAKSATSEETTSPPATSATLPDLKQIGYIIIGENNQQHFIPFDEANNSAQA